MASSLSGPSGAASGSEPLSGTTQYSQNTLLNSHTSSSLPSASGMPLSQQAAYQQNSQLPMVDLDVLANISPEQLAAIGQLFLSGAIHLPPQAPVPQLPDVAPVPNPSLPPSSTKAPTATEADSNVMELDKEEGELEEGEVGDTSEARDFLRPPPKGPRNRSASPSRSHGREVGRRQGRHSPHNAAGERKASGQLVNRGADAVELLAIHKNGTVVCSVPLYDIATNVVAVKHRIASPPPSRHAAKPTSMMRHRNDKRDAAKNFIFKMYENGYGFEDLKHEVKTPDGLRALYQELSLPINSLRAEAKTQGPNPEPQYVQQAQTHSGVAPPPLAAQPSPSLQQAGRKASSPKRAMPAKPTPPQDRKEYLARLQAAKTKKFDMPPAQKPALLESSQDPPGPAETPAGTIAPSTRPTLKKGLDPKKNELLRQKLAALKAEQANKRHNASVPGEVAIAPQTALQPSERVDLSGEGSRSVNLGAGLVDIFSRAAKEVTQADGAPFQSDPPRQLIQPSASPLPAQTAIPPVRQLPATPSDALPGLFIPSQSSRSAVMSERGSAKSPLTNDAAPAFSSIAKPGNQASQGSHTISSATSTSSQVPLQAPRKRPVAADLNEPTESQQSASSRRPLGQSMNESINERMIIQVSEDESELDHDDDEMDESSQSGVGLSRDDVAKVSVGSLPDLPRKRDFPAASGLSTPTTQGIGTPNNAAYQRKMQEIELAKQMILELERRSRTKVNGNATPASASQRSGSEAATSVSNLATAAVPSLSGRDDRPTHDNANSQSLNPDSGPLSLESALDSAMQSVQDRLLASDQRLKSISSDEPVVDPHVAAQYAASLFPGLLAATQQLQPTSRGTSVATQAVDTEMLDRDEDFDSIYQSGDDSPQPQDQSVGVDIIRDAPRSEQTALGPGGDFGAHSPDRAAPSQGIAAQVTPKIDMLAKSDVDDDEEDIDFYGPETPTQDEDSAKSLPMDLEDRGQDNIDDVDASSDVPSHPIEQADEPVPRPTPLSPKSNRQSPGNGLNIARIVNDGIAAELDEASELLPPDQQHLALPSQVRTVGSASNSTDQSCRTLASRNHTTVLTRALWCYSETIGTTRTF